MHRRSPTSTIVLGSLMAAAVLLGAASGCGGGSADDQARVPAAPASATPVTDDGSAGRSSGGPMNRRSGSKSTLGKARDYAEGVIGDAERRSREIAEKDWSP